MALQGDLATFPVRDLLEMLARTRASGRLSVSRGMAARRFHLRDGCVLLASSSDEQTLLGRLLVDRGLIDEAQLTQALTTRTEASPKGRTRPRLGKTLTEAGLVSPDQLLGVLAEKIERMVVDTMAWQEGHFYFDDEAPPRRPAAIASAVDLSGLLDRFGARPAARSRSEIFAICDADVIEMRPLAAPAPASLESAAEPRTRRRKRGVAVA
jgi:hypothetical protein